MRKLEAAIETALCTLCVAGIFAFTLGVTTEGKINAAIVGAIAGALGLWSLRAIFGLIRDRHPPLDAP